MTAPANPQPPAPSAAPPSAPAPPAPSPPAPTAPAPTSLQLTQEELNHRMAAEKTQGHGAGRREVLSELGFESPEKAKEFIEAARATQRQHETDAERLRREAEEDRTKAAQERADGRLLKVQAAVELALTQAGLLDAAKRQRATAMVTIPDDAADLAAAATAEVTKLKSEMPELFTGTPTPTPAIPGSLPTGPAPTPTADASALEAGREEARRRFGVPEKTSA